MAVPNVFKLKLVLSPDPSGGYVVTCPDVPELITEGDTAAEALANVKDAIAAVRELYEDTGRPLPPAFRPVSPAVPVTFETVIEAA